MFRNVLLSLVFAVPASLASASEPVDWETVTRIRHEGFHNSHVERLLSELMDGIGPRITNSPQHEASVDWAMETLREWGIEAWDHEFEFGRGWSWDTASFTVLEPYVRSIEVLPNAWSPGTQGKVRGEAMLIHYESEADLDSLRGKVAGKILFVDKPRGLEPGPDTPFERHTDESLDDLCTITPPAGNFDGYDDKTLEKWRKRTKLRAVFLQFCEDEEVVGFVTTSSRDHGNLRATRYGARPQFDPDGVPGLAIVSDQYNRICRALDDSVKVVIEFESGSRFHDEDTIARNAIGDIKGKSDEIVMVGAHLDSWHGATGATDNGASCVAIMEAMRILKSLDEKPRRTIRVALWAGEEQGLLGSWAYNEDFIAHRPLEPGEEAYSPSIRKLSGPIQPKDGHKKHSVVFNLDNGAGRIRGIYTQENLGVIPIFKAWLEPFADLEATTVTPRNTGSTDHYPFDRSGIPGFQFIQDRLQYFPRTHHSVLDVLEQVPIPDVKQSAVIIASFLWHAANRDEMLPRKPMPGPKAQ
jgi:hypothetical protein